MITDIVNKGTFSPWFLIIFEEAHLDVKKLFSSSDLIIYIYSKNTGKITTIQCFYAIKGLIKLIINI